MNSLPPIIQELASWRSILDFAIISGGLYVLCRTLSRLDTWKIVAGILYGFPVLVLAGMLRLKGGGWLLQKLSHVARLGVRRSSA